MHPNERVNPQTIDQSSLHEPKHLIEGPRIRNSCTAWILRIPFRKVQESRVKVPHKNHYEQGHHTCRQLTHIGGLVILMHFLSELCLRLISVNSPHYVNSNQHKKAQNQILTAIQRKPVKGCTRRVVALILAVNSLLDRVVE